jgi:SAM-dependent methyltransferase
VRRPDFIARQSACPSGFLGHLIGRVMAVETASANHIAVDLLDVQETDHVLEIGFGHGTTIATLAEKARRGWVAGVDISAAMLHMAGRRNRDGIRRGRVELRQARAEELPYSGGRFHRALSVHTLYFWPEPRHALVEVRRVLKPGGRFVLCWRADPDAARQFPEPTYRFHGEETVQEMLTAAGFHRVGLSRDTVGRATLHFAVAETPDTPV